MKLAQILIEPQFIEEAKELRIPQFFIQTTPDLFGEEFELLEPENLSEGFTLSGQDASISFQLAIGEVYSIDIQSEGEAVPKYRPLFTTRLEDVPKDQRPDESPVVVFV